MIFEDKCGYAEVSLNVKVKSWDLRGVQDEDSCLVDLQTNFIKDVFCVIICTYMPGALRALMGLTHIAESMTEGIALNARTTSPIGSGDQCLL